MASPTAAPIFSPNFFLHLLSCSLKDVFRYGPQYIYFSVVLSIQFPPFQMNTEILTNPTTTNSQQWVRYSLVEVQKQQVRADCALITDILCLIARDNSLQQETELQTWVPSGSQWQRASLGWRRRFYVLHHPCTEWCLLTSGAFGSSENFLSLERSSPVYSFALSVPRKRVFLAALNQNSNERKNKAAGE